MGNSSLEAEAAFTEDEGEIERAVLVTSSSAVIYPSSVMDSYSTQIKWINAPNMKLSKLSISEYI